MQISTLLMTVALTYRQVCQECPSQDRLLLGPLPFFMVVSEVLETYWWEGQETESLTIFSAAAKWIVYI